MAENTNVDVKCPAISPNGTECIKTMYVSRSGEIWDHAGGHIFATEKTLNVLNNYHYDAGALLAGEPVTYHTPEECTYTGVCAWRNSIKI